MKHKTVCIVGLGYVGLPLAEAFARHLKVMGYDIDEAKVGKLNAENDKDNIEFTTDPSKIKHVDFVIIAVPTPVTKSKEPDLSYVKSAAETVGKSLKSGATVVLESTVYPGVTEEVVAPILERESKMKCGIEFYIGYSPERINPGDEAHALTKITKIVAGMDKLFCFAKTFTKKCLRHFLLRKRNISLVKFLKLFKRKVYYDQLLSKEEIKGFGVNALDNLDVKLKMDGVIVAVAHDEFKNKSFLSTGSFFRKKV
jgi:UDP-N-acetyl-D-mannosaminuronate dehydrogenase